MSPLHVTALARFLRSVSAAAVELADSLDPPAPKRNDGIGPLGNDPLALTSVDHNGVPRSFPRRSSDPPKSLNFSRGGLSDDDIDRLVPNGEAK